MFVGWGSSGLPIETLLLFYVAAYVTLTFFVGLLLSYVTALGRGQSSLGLFMVEVTTFRLRWVWLLLLVNLAGLPPAFFFGPKLGLLSVFIRGGLFITTLAIMLGVFLGWAAYYALAQRFLSSFVSAPSAPLRYRGGSSFTLTVFCLICFFLIGGAVFLDDFFLLTYRTVL